MFDSQTKEDIVVAAYCQTLYYNGAKNFWVHGTGPLGCLPQKLAAPRPHDGDLDYNGCLKTLNDGAYEFNNQLCAACDDLRSHLRGATIVYTDVLMIKYDLIANHTAYGAYTYTAVIDRLTSIIN